MNNKHKFSNLYLGLIPLALGVFVAADDQTARLIGIQHARECSKEIVIVGHAALYG